jgi:hypothetical protein
VTALPTDATRTRARMVDGIQVLAWPGFHVLAHYGALRRPSIKNRAKSVASGLAASWRIISAI